MKQRSDRLALIILFFITVLFAAINIKDCIKNGRLSVPPGADDVVYMVDAGSRLLVLKAQGVFPFLKQLFKAPPHAPLSTLLGLIAFGVYGIQAWAVYCINGNLIFGLMALSYYILKDLSRWYRVIFSGLLLAFPFSGIFIQEFRADTIWALSLVAAVLITLDVNFEHLKNRRLYLKGLLWASVFLAKPTLFLFSGFILAICCTALWVQFGKKSAKKIIKLMTVSVVCFLPYLFSNYQHLFEYISLGMLSKMSHKFHSDLSFFEHITYYLFGEGEQFSLGPLFLIPCLIIIVYGRLLFQNKDSRFIWKLKSLSVVVFVLWVVPSMIRLKNPFLGIPLTLLVTLLSYLVLNQVAALQKQVKAFKGWFPHNIHAVLVYALVIVFFYAPYPRYFWDFNPSGDARAQENIWQTSRGVYQKIKHDLLIRGDSSLRRVIVLNDGIANAETLNWYALEDELALEFEFPIIVKNYESLVQSIKAKDYVVVSPRAEKALFTVQEYSAVALRELQKNKNFMKIGEIAETNQSSTEPHWYIFKNRNKINLK